MKSILMISIVFSAAMIGACNADSGCAPNEYQTCLEGATYWADSCGHLEVMIEQCQCGCMSDQSGCNQDCNCTPDCQGRLCGDDGCGGSCGECGADESCDDDGQCQAMPDDCRQASCPGGYYCDLNSGNCILGCLDDNGCKSDQICVDRQCRTGCRYNSGCDAGSWCDFSVRECVACSDAVVPAGTTFVRECC